MTKWIADYEVESHFSIVEHDLKLKYKHPSELYEIHIKNLDVQPPIERPLLSLQIILACDSIDDVSDKSRVYLKLFLNVLSLLTNSKFSIHRLIRIVDWTPGLEMRDCHQFFESPDPNLPVPLLDDKILESVDTLMRNNLTDDLALRWFSRGVGANYLDEQFQYFWFALETLAEKDKAPIKVPDKCPKCKNQLYCETCKETPVHRPYPKQAIEQLIKKVVIAGPEKLYEILSKVRHSLLHGYDSDAIEKELQESSQLDMSQLVDILGKTVWAALITSFKASPGKKKLMFFENNSYSHRKIVTTTIGKAGSRSCKDDPQIEKIAKVEMKLHVHDEQDVEK